MAKEINFRPVFAFNDAPQVRLSCRHSQVAWNVVQPLEATQTVMQTNKQNLVRTITY